MTQLSQNAIPNSSYQPNTGGFLSESAQSGFDMMHALEGGGSPQNSIITTAGPATNSFNNYSSSLNSMLMALNGDGTYKLPGSDMNIGNVNDAYTQMLDRISRGEDASTKALIGTINAARSNRQNEMATQYERYKGGLQLLGIQHNDAQATPELLMGHIQQAENEHQAKLQALDVETNKALMDAEQAKNKNDLATLKEKMDYVDKLKQEKRDYLKQVAEQMNAANTIADNVVQGAYDQLQKLSPADKEKYLIAVSQKYGISLGALTAAMVRESRTRSDRTSKGKTGSEKSLSILDIQRYNDLYPDAGVIAGDTEAQAIAKVAATNTPEAKIRNTIQTIMDGGGTYEEVLAEIGDDPEQIAIAKEVFGISDEPTETQPSSPTGFPQLPSSMYSVPGVGPFAAIINGISSLFD